MKKRKTKKMNLRKLTIAKINSRAFLELRGGEIANETFATEISQEVTCPPSIEGCEIDFTTTIKPTFPPPTSIG